MFKKTWRIGYETHAYEFDYVRYKCSRVAHITEVWSYEDGKCRSRGRTTFIGSLIDTLKEVS